MAIFVDLDDDSYPEESKETGPADLETEGGAMSSTTLAVPCSETSSCPTAPRGLTWLAAAWPVITSIASHLDHNDLSSLASTCKQMRQNMLQYQKNLLDASLMCSTKQSKRLNQSPHSRKVPRAGDLSASREENAHPKQSTRLNQSPSSRKVLCTRDLVARCGTCGEPTCRNCVYVAGKLREEERKLLACRVKRLCKQCQTTPEILPGKPEFNMNRKICSCVCKMLWQCPSCRANCVSSSNPHSFLHLLHREKLNLIQHISCSHFNPPSRPPNSQRVWVEACPASTHPPLLSLWDCSTFHCSMEVYPGGWAWQDISTGYIYRPLPSACIGATAEWWSRLPDDPNQGGFIALPAQESSEIVSGILCTDPRQPKLLRLAGKGMDSRGVEVALWKFGEVSDYAEMNFTPQSWRQLVLSVEKRYTLLAEEQDRMVRGWCTWCEGVVYSRDDERYIGS